MLAESGFKTTLLGAANGQEGEESDSSVELDTVDYRNEALLGLPEVPQCSLSHSETLDLKATDARPAGVLLKSAWEASCRSRCADFLILLMVQVAS